MLRYSLVDSALKSVSKGFTAQVVDVRSFTHEEIIELMLKRGTSVTKTDILAVFQVYQEVICSLCDQGSSIHTPLFHIQPSISGVFQHVEDHFDPSCHKVNLKLAPGKLLRKAVKFVKVKKVKEYQTAPLIAEVKDLVSGKSNQCLTPGGMIQVSGSRLRFWEDKPGDGLCLVDENGLEYSFPTVAKNKPAQLIALIPADLLPGIYYLEVRTTYASGGTHRLKQLKYGRFKGPLTV